MVEQGKVVSLLDRDIAEVELSSNKNCAQCGCAGGGCMPVVSGAMVLKAYNGVSAKLGDTVKVIIGGNKITAGFLLYILPIISFFLCYILADKIFHIKSEPVFALIGFCGIFLTFLIIKLFSTSSDKKNFVIEIVEKHKLLD